MTTCRKMSSPATSDGSIRLSWMWRLFPLKQASWHMRHTNCTTALLHYYYAATQPIHIFCDSHCKMNYSGLSPSSLGSLLARSGIGVARKKNYSSFLKVETGLGPASTRPKVVQGTPRWGRSTRRRSLRRYKQDEAGWTHQKVSREQFHLFHSSESLGSMNSIYVFT